MSRAIAWPCGLILIGLAFVPRLAGLFAVMPPPVMGAVLVYVACYMILGGIQVITSRMLDARRTFVVGIPLFFGLSVEMAPELYERIPGAAHALFSSALSLGTALAVALNLLFRLGVARRRTFALEAGAAGAEHVYRTMEEAGGAWGARPEVIHRATAALQELQEALYGAGRTRAAARVDARFSEFSLDLDVQYDGPPIQFPSMRPSEAELLAGEAGFASLAAYLVRHHADRIRAEVRHGRPVVHLHFEH
jgi:NCS2 family nucleobase:cation symporter-2